MVFHSIFSPCSTLKVDHSNADYSSVEESQTMIILMNELSDAGNHSRNNVILRSCMCIISLVASITLIWMIRRSHAGFSITYHRLQLGLSITDILFSLFVGCFNMMAPRENSYFSWNAKGNMASCAAQGFITYFAFTASGFYSISLNLYYLAVVKYEKTDEYIGKKLEPFLHGIPTIFALFMSITLLAFGSFNDDGDICWSPINNPLHCTGIEDGQIRDGFEIPCGRGRGGFFIYNIFFQVKVFSPPVIAGVAIILLYRTVVQVEKKTSKYGASAYKAKITESNQLRASSTAEEIGGDHACNVVKRWFSSRLPFLQRCRRDVISKSNERSHSRMVMYKAIAYTLAYSLTWIFLLYYFFMGDILEKPIPIEVVYLANIFIPVQGVYNLLIYFVPIIISTKNKSKREPLSWRQATIKAFWSKGGNRRKNRSGGGTPSTNKTTIRRGGRMPVKKKLRGKTPSAVHTSRLRDHENRTTTDRTVTFTDDYQGGASNSKEIVGSKMLKKEKHNLRIDKSIKKIAEDAALPLIETDIENGLSIAKESDIPKIELSHLTDRFNEGVESRGQVIEMISEQNANSLDSIQRNRKA